MLFVYTAYLHFSRRNTTVCSLCIYYNRHYIYIYIIYVYIYITIYKRKKCTYQAWTSRWHSGDARRGNPTLCARLWSVAIKYARFIERKCYFWRLTSYSGNSLVYVMFSFANGCLPSLRFFVGCLETSMILSSDPFTQTIKALNMWQGMSVTCVYVSAYIFCEGSERLKSCRPTFQLCFEETEAVRSNISFI